MSGFVLHPEALADLEEIWQFIAADNLDAADRVLEQIHEAIRVLLPFPQQGHRRPDLTARPLRFQPAGRRIWTRSSSGWVKSFAEQSRRGRVLVQ